MGKASRAKKAKAQEHPCPRCGLNLVEAKTTLGHDDIAYAAHKLKVERDAARKKKKGRGEEASEELNRRGQPMPPLLPLPLPPPPLDPGRVPGCD